jgi:hypothetical protein
MEAKEQMNAKEPKNVVQLNEVRLEDLKEVLDTIEEAQYTLNTIEYLTSEIHTSAMDLKFSLMCLFLACVSIVLFYPFI